MGAAPGSCARSSGLDLAESLAGVVPYEGCLVQAPTAKARSRSGRYFQVISYPAGKRRLTRVARGPCGPHCVRLTSIGQQPTQPNSARVSAHLPHVPTLTPWTAFTCTLGLPDIAARVTRRRGVESRALTKMHRSPIAVEICCYRVRPRRLRPEHHRVVTVHRRAIWAVALHLGALGALSNAGDARHQYRFAICPPLRAQREIAERVNPRAAS